MDIIDEANERADLFRENALNAARQIDTSESPLYIDGARCCLDCKKPIPRGRLKVNPGAVRCVGCQEKKERSK
jgi:DnaK suppressor protein